MRYDVIRIIAGILLTKDPKGAKSYTPLLPVYTLETISLKELGFWPGRGSVSV